MKIKELYKIADFKDKTGFLFNEDCINLMEKMDNESVNMVLTDIPYDMVNRKSNGLRNLDKKEADVLTFDMDVFLKEVYRITKGNILIFCGVNQVSYIYNFFANKQNKKQGTVRQIIWEKTNPSPMNGQFVYLSGIENAIWFKKKGGTFNARCKNVVFKHPNGRSKIHPTEKNHNLLKEIILDNTNEKEIIFDPCCGSGSHCVCAKELNRRYIGCELKKEYYEKCVERFL